MLSRSTLLRLEIQLEAVPQLLAGASKEEIDARSPTGQWSARENLAHLARHHAIMLDRLRRILNEDVPLLERYSAETDLYWPEWSSLGLDEILRRLTKLRAELIQLIVRMTPGEIERKGIHPLLGEMGFASWLEFFLLHEAHHLYTVMIRLGQARSGNKPAE
jgi:hypothetical protein